MPEETRLSKAELLAHIATSWSELDNLVTGLDDSALNRINPASGWAIKDNLVHLAMWERGIVYLLSRRPRPKGMGISAEQWKALTLDEINAVIYRQWRNRPAVESRETLRAAHSEMLAILADLDDEALYLDYSDYDETAARAGQPVMDWVIGNTFKHFDEHAGYIRETLQSQADHNQA